MTRRPKTTPPLVGAEPTLTPTAPQEGPSDRPPPTTAPGPCGHTKAAILTAYRRVLTGAHGADRWIKALATGDLAHPDTVAVRLEICRGCPSHTVAPARAGLPESSWCGRPLAEDYGAEAPTCGCLLAGKARVGSETCPQGKW